MKKHAYLIIAHNNFDFLKKEIEMLDDDRNDIYIHVDKKSEFDDKTKNYITKSISKSKCNFVERINVNWGGYSQVICELTLLKAAAEKHYSYYHLISGADFPTKTQDEIHKYFGDNEGKEYIDFDSIAIKNQDYIERIKYYRFMQDSIGRNRGKKIALYEKIENISLIIQKIIHIDRTKKGNYTFYKGGQWFSITDNMVQYIIDNEKEIKKLFDNGICVDELFLQTFAMQSPYKDNIDKDVKRYIDWDRGSPYTFTDDDYDDVMNNKAFFARKFDYSKYPKIVDEMYRTIKSQVENR